MSVLYWKKIKPVQWAYPINDLFIKIAQKLTKTKLTAVFENIETILFV
jgi:hypothetical protein